MSSAVGGDGHVHQQPCPHCGHGAAETVDAHIKGHGSFRTIAIRECQQCGQLWGEARNFYGVIEDE